MCIVRDDTGSGFGFGGGGVGGGGFTPMAPGGSGGGSFTGGGGQVGNGALLISAGQGAADYAAAQQRAAATGAVSPTSGQTAKQYTAAGSKDRAFVGADYFKQFPDVASEYARVNGPGLAQGLGLSGDKSANLTADQFAEWHINQPGNGDFRTAYYGLASSEGDKAKTDPTTDLVTHLTNGFNTTIQGLQNDNKTLLDSITQGQNTLTTTITGMQQDFAKSQTALIGEMQAASARQAEAMMKAIKDAQAQSGQKEKKPSYGKALDKNKQLNGSGLGSTGLTGSGGVPQSALTLGSTSILGGGA